MIYIFLILLLLIFLQDLKERQVYWFLLIIAIFIGGYIYYQKTILQIFIINVGSNLLFVLFLFFVLKLYSKYKLQKNLFEAIGGGDFLFFLVISVSFPITSFMVLFSVSLIFSLILFISVKPFLKKKTVPLAGFQALFFMLVLLLNTAFKWVDLYAI